MPIEPLASSCWLNGVHEFLPNLDETAFSRGLLIFEVRLKAGG